MLLPLGVLGMLGVLASSFMVAAGSASHPSIYVPARSGGWQGWLAGPFEGLGVSPTNFQTFTLVMCASYLLVLACARSVPFIALAATILAAHVIFLVGPPLISQDVFGYLGYARLGVLHGLDPYTHVTAQAATDPVFPFLGWPHQHSPYGPLFTLGTYAITPLGLAGGLWALKVLSVLASLCAVALVARAAAREGRSPALATVFVGLNPVLLELAVGGDHNDTIVMALLAAALAASAASSALGAGEPSTQPHKRAAVVALVAGIGVKASAGLVLPFALLSPPRWRERVRLAAYAAGALVVLAALAIVGFGTHALGFLNALGEQQQLVATHSIPAETARWIGLHGTPGWWRHAFVAALAVVLALTLWRTARGADWRTMAGWATLALLASTAWLLPWYVVWALPLAALGSSRVLRVATILCCAYAISIHLPLASPLLSPPKHHGHAARHPPPGAPTAPGAAGA